MQQGPKRRAELKNRNLKNSNSCLPPNPRSTPPTSTVCSYIFYGPSSYPTCVLFPVRFPEELYLFDFQEITINACRSASQQAPRARRPGNNSWDNLLPSLLPTFASRGRFPERGLRGFLLPARICTSGHHARRSQKFKNRGGGSARRSQNFPKQWLSGLLAFVLSKSFTSLANSSPLATKLTKPKPQGT